MNKTNNYFGRKSKVSSAVFTVMLLSLMATTPSFATNYTLSVTSSGAQNINVSSAGTGSAISADAVNVATNCRYGYNFTISTSVNDNKLYLNGDATNNATGTYFSASDGTTPLANTNNTWGYFFDNNSATIPTVNSVFSPVPTLGNANVLKSPLASPSDTDINDNFNIYYGVKTDTNMASGTYKMIPDTNNSNNDGTIVYMTTIAESCIKYTVQFNPTDTSSGSNVSGTGTMSPQMINEGVATSLSANTFTAPSGYSFAGWNTAQDGTGTWYDDGQSVTDLATVGNTITLYAQWTLCPSNYICYDKNEGTDTTHQVVGTMGQQPVEASDTSITLLASNYSREDYGFAGWSDKPDYATNNQAHLYGPQEYLSITAGQYSHRGLMLYAVWIASAGSLQDSTKVAELCGTGQGSLTTAPTDGTANLSSVSALTDQRDNETYAIAKLADGNCWMIENLRLEAEHTRSAEDQALAQGYGTSSTYGNFGGLADAESTGFSSTYSANSLYSNDGSNDTINIGTSNYPAYRMPRYNNFNTQQRAENASDTYVNTYSYGNYYTWHAAIADTTYYSSGDHGTTSLCPTGWRLPIGNQSTATNSFGALSVALGGPEGGARANSRSTPRGTVMSNTFTSFPNNFLYSGYFDTSLARSRGSLGYYWSSTVGYSEYYSSEYYSYHLYLGSNEVSPGTSGGYKYYSSSIRCTVSAGT